jgi:hypothetical protein
VRLRCSEPRKCELTLRKDWRGGRGMKRSGVKITEEIQ